MNEVLKDKSGKVLNPKIPRYDKLKYILSSEETETGRIVQYSENKYKEYCRLYEINMSGTSNVVVNHELSNFILTKVEAIEKNLSTGSQFTLPSYRPTFLQNGMGLYLSSTQIVIESAEGSPNRDGHVALVTLYYIKLNEPIN